MAEAAPRPVERAILVAVTGARRSRSRSAVGGTARPSEERDPQADLSELALLAQTAGAEVVGHILQRGESVHPATFLSRGKLTQMGELVAAQHADVVIFDEDLSPGQARNLERVLQCKVIDRSELILDIFALRARTREAQTQVELAQLEYQLPRLARLWSHLSRLGGGIGTRGPGETQLEVDRRRVRERIHVLRRRLLAIEREREVQGQRRRRLLRASLVGYTNAGKSTLFNALTGAGVLEEDRLFATLDTTTRRLVLASGEVLLLSDTVGFIRKLPHHLVASFRATLREVRESDLLIHVVDAAQPGLRAQMAVVERAVEELRQGCPVLTLLVLNKADRLRDEDAIALRAEFPQAAILSALDGRQVARFRESLLTSARACGLGAAQTARAQAAGWRRAGPPAASGGGKADG